jgi:hypothetical protein
LPSPDPFPQDRPGHHQKPQGHHIDENGCFSGCPGLQSPERASDKSGGLKKSQRDDIGKRRDGEGASEKAKKREKDHGSTENPQGGEQEGRAVLEADLHHDPVVSPDQGEKPESDERSGPVQHACSIPE